MLFARFGAIGFLSHLRSLRRYNEPEILHFALTSICRANADAGQLTGWKSPIISGSRSRMALLYVNKHWHK
jgi:hypothetical protein